MSYIQSINNLIAFAQRKVVDDATERIGNKGNEKGTWKGYNENGDPVFSAEGDLRVYAGKLSFNTGLPRNTPVHLDSLNVISQQSNFQELEQIEREEEERFEDDFFQITREDGLCAIVRLRRRKQTIVYTRDQDENIIDQTSLRRYYADMVVLSYGAVYGVELDQEKRRISALNGDNWYSLFVGPAVKGVAERIDLVSSLDYLNEYSSYIVRPWDVGVVLGNGLTGGLENGLVRNGYNLYVSNPGAKAETYLAYADINYASIDFGDIGTKLYKLQGYLDNNYSFSKYWTLQGRNPDLDFNFTEYEGNNLDAYLNRDAIIYDSTVDPVDGYGNDVDAHKFTVRLGSATGPVLLTSAALNSNVYDTGGCEVNHKGALDFRYNYDLFGGGQIEAWGHPVISSDGLELSLNWTDDLSTYPTSVRLENNTGDFGSDILWVFNWEPYVTPGGLYYVNEPYNYLNVISQSFTVSTTTYPAYDAWHPDYTPSDLGPAVTPTPGFSLLEQNAKVYDDHSSRSVSKLNQEGYGSAIIRRKYKIEYPLISDATLNNWQMADGLTATPTDHLIVQNAPFVREKINISSVPPASQTVTDFVDTYSRYTSKVDGVNDPSGPKKVERPSNTFEVAIFSGSGVSFTGLTLGTPERYYWPLKSLELYGVQFWIGSPENIGGLDFEDLSSPPPVVLTYPCLWADWVSPRTLAFTSVRNQIICAEETEKYYTDRSTSGGGSDQRYVEWVTLSNDPITDVSTMTARYGTLMDFQNDPFGAQVVASYVLDGEPPSSPPQTRFNKISYHPTTNSFLDGSYAKGRRKRGPEQVVLHLSDTGALSVVRPIGQDRPISPVYSLEDRAVFDSYVGKKSFANNVFTSAGISELTILEDRGGLTPARKTLAAEIQPLPLAAVPNVSALFKNKNLNLTASRGRIVLGQL